MEKKSFVSRLVGEWNTMSIVGIAIGAALFGVLMRFASIPVATNTYLTTAMLATVVVGGLFGPIPAMIAAGIGNVIADLLFGGGFWFDWSIGNAILGFFIGALPLYGANIKDGIFNTKHMIIYVVFVVIGNLVAFELITPILTYYFYSSELTITFAQTIASSIANVIVLTVAGIPILKALASRYARGTNLTKED